MDDTVACFYLRNTFRWLSLQVEIVNKWLPERVVLGFFFFLALIGKLSTNGIILLQKKKKRKVIQAHLSLSSRYSVLMLPCELIVRRFLKRSIIYKNIYVLKGANQPQAGHVTGHADLRIISDFLKNLRYMQMLYRISYQCNNAILMSEQSCGL